MGSNNMLCIQGDTSATNRIASIEKFIFNQNQTEED